MPQVQFLPGASEKEITFSLERFKMAEKKSPIRDPRFANLDVVRVWNEETGRFYAAHTENISRSGLFIITHNPLPVGSKVRLKFTLMTEAENKKGRSVDLRAVEVYGEVVRMISLKEVEPGLNPGMGIRFIDLPDDVRNSIDGIVVSGLDPTARG